MAQPASAGVNLGAERVKWGAAVVNWGDSGAGAAAPGVHSGELEAIDPASHTPFRQDCHYIATIIRHYSCQEARCVCRQAAGKEHHKSYILLDFCQIQVRPGQPWARRSVFTLPSRQPGLYAHWWPIHLECCCSGRSRGTPSGWWVGKQKWLRKIRQRLTCSHCPAARCFPGIRCHCYCPARGKGSRCLNQALVRHEMQESQQHWRLQLQQI